MQDIDLENALQPYKSTKYDWRGFCQTEGIKAKYHQTSGPSAKIKLLS